MVKQQIPFSIAIICINVRFFTVLFEIQFDDFIQMGIASGMYIKISFGFSEWEGWPSDT